jgi:basic membrane lipoprotein Med (substrate-binding protein (PBP1-ABC) superfamily)
VGVYDMIAAIVTGNLDDFPGGSNYILDVANGGIGFAPKHDADIDDAIYEAVEEILQQMIDGEITTGVDPVTGNLIEEEEQAEPTPDATPGS